MLDIKFVRENPEAVSYTHLLELKNAAGRRVAHIDRGGVVLGIHKAGVDRIREMAHLPVRPRLGIDAKLFTGAEEGAIAICVECFHLSLIHI